MSTQHTAQSLWDIDAGPPRRRKEVPVRENGDGCWLWTGAKTREGYGFVRSPGTRTNEYAHRYFWRLSGKRLKSSPWQLDHLCANRGCVNPDHLELVHARENSRRAGVRWAKMLASIECPHCKKTFSMSKKTRS